MVVGQNSGAIYMIQHDITQVIVIIYSHCFLYQNSYRHPSLCRYVFLALHSLLMYFFKFHSSNHHRMRRTRTLSIILLVIDLIQVD